jgi:hypothetical protein
MMRPTQQPLAWPASSLGIMRAPEEAGRLSCCHDCRDRGREVQARGQHVTIVKRLALHGVAVSPPLGTGNAAFQDGSFRHGAEPRS